MGYESAAHRCDDRAEVAVMQAQPLHLCAASRCIYVRPIHNSFITFHHGRSCPGRTQSSVTTPLWSRLSWPGMTLFRRVHHSFIDGATRTTCIAPNPIHLLPAPAVSSPPAPITFNFIYWRARAVFYLEPRGLGNRVRSA